jgi:hypothetical protein
LQRIQSKPIDKNMRAYMPSIKQRVSNGDKRRQTRHKIASQSSFSSSNYIFPEASTNQDEVGDAWPVFSNQNEVHVRKKIQKSAVNANTTYSTPSEVLQQPQQFTVQFGNQINLDPTASTTSSSGSRTAHNSPRIDTPITFHFDIEVVKTTARTSESSQDFEGSSKASSSTISTQSTTCQRMYPTSNHNIVVPSLCKKVSSQPLTKKRISQNDIRNIFGDFSLQNLDDDTMIKHANNGSSPNDEARTTPVYFDNKHRMEEEGDDSSWINFALGSFIPVEQALQNSSMTKTLEPTHRTPQETEQLKSSQLQPKTFSQEKKQSAPTTASNGTFQTNINKGKRNTSWLTNESVTASIKSSNAYPSSVIGSNQRHESNERTDAQANPYKSKVGKMVQNSMFLQDMLQKKMGNGPPAMQTESTKRDLNATKPNALLRRMLQNKQTGREAAASFPIQKPQIQREPTELTNASNANSLSSSMLQERKAGTTASVPLQISHVHPKGLKNLSEQESPCTTSFSHPLENAVGVEWADLSETAFTTALQANVEYAKYSKMLQVGLPMAVVKNAMQRDGIMMQSANKGKQNGDSELKQRFRIHWTVHNNVRSNTLWAMIQRERHWLADVVLDEAELASWFQKKESAVQKTECARMEPKPKVQRGIIDPKRANNCGILLATIKMSYAEIAQVIDHFSIDKLTVTQMHGLSTCLPNADEVEALKKENKKGTNISEKSECERFMVEMMRIENAKEKLEAMSFLKRLPTRLGELLHGTLLLE